MLTQIKKIGLFILYLLIFLFFFKDYVQAEVLIGHKEESIDEKIIKIIRENCSIEENKILEKLEKLYNLSISFNAEKLYNFNKGVYYPINEICSPITYRVDDNRLIRYIELGNCANLEIEIYNEIISKDFFDLLSKCQHVNTLCFINCRFKNDFQLQTTHIKHLNSLMISDIDWYYNRFEMYDKKLPIIKYPNNLFNAIENSSIKILHLNEVGIVDVKSIVNSQIHALHISNISDEELSILTLNKNLKILAITNSRLNGKSASYLTQTQLESLKLINCSISKDFFKKLQNSNIIHLIYSGNYNKDLALDILNMKKLKFFCCEKNFFNKACKDNELLCLINNRNIALIDSTREEDEINFFEGESLTPKDLVIVPPGI